MKSMNTLILAILFTFTFAFSTVFSQHDTMYVMKDGVVINKQSIKAADLDSIKFLSLDTMSFFKNNQVVNKQSIQTSEVDSVIFYKPTIEETRSGTFTDTRDGNVYNWVQIGDQVWMAENLAYLPSVNQAADGSEDAAGSCYYVYGYEGTNVTDAKATSNYTTYGVLYNWTAAMGGDTSSTANPSGVQGVCPTGWHLPSDDEWKELEMALGMSQADADVTEEWRGTNEGSKLADNKGLWDEGALENDADFGTSGFTALPGGSSYENGSLSFYGISSDGYWWSATESGTWNAIYRFVAYDTSGVYSSSYDKNHGYSARCVKD